jgi:hypothetical protein
MRRMHVHTAHGSLPQESVQDLIGVAAVGDG